MNEEFEYEGVWWLPEKSDRKIAGKLKFTPTDGAILTLSDSLDDKDLKRILNGSEFFNPLLILGISRTSELITLYNNQEMGFKQNFPGGKTLIIRTKFIFINAHFLNVEDVKFKTLFVHFSNLDEWVSLQGFQFDLSEGKFALSYERPSPFKMRINDLELSIEVRGPSITHERISQITISQEAWVGLKSSSERPLEEFISIMQQIQNFLTLAMNYPAYPLRIKSTAEVLRESPDEDQKPDVLIDIFYELPRWPGKIKSLYYPDMLFTLPEVQEQLEIYIDNWIKTVELLNPIYAMYFAIHYNPLMFIENKFLNLTQAIESYHSRKIGGQYQPNDEYEGGLFQKFLSVIPPDLDPDFKQSLKRGKLKYANRFSLRKRLKDLTERLSSKYPLNFLQEDFINKVSQTRNYLTHFDLDAKVDAAEGLELNSLIDKLQVIIKILFLDEIGFSDQDILKIISKQYSFNEFLKPGN